MQPIRSSEIVMLKNNRLTLLGQDGYFFCFSKVIIAQIIITNVNKLSYVTM